MELVQGVIWNPKYMYFGCQFKYVCTLFGSVKVVLEKWYSFYVLNRLEGMICIKMKWCRNSVSCVVGVPTLNVDPSG